VADVDANGSRELVVAAARGDTLAVFFQRDLRVFDSHPLLLPLPRFSAPHAVLALDLDGDGDQDLVSANRGSLESTPLIDLHTNLTTFLQTSPGRFASPQLTLGDSTSTFGPRALAASDMDGDGDQDLSSANIGRDTVAIFVQNSPGHFDAAPLQLGNSAATDNPTALAAGDLDGDGDQDLVCVCEPAARDRLVLLRQAPDPLQFDAVSLEQVSIQQLRSVSVADLNQDGRLDLVAGTDTSIALLHQNGSGGFTLQPLIPAGAPAYALSADLDHDGRADLVAVDQGGNRLRTFYQGAVAGDYLADDQLTGMTGPRHASAADLDRDGDLDLVSANVGSDDLTVFRNNGLRVFGTAPVSRLDDDSDPDDPFVDPTWVTATDLDGDGDLELISAQAPPANFETGHGLTVFVQNWPEIYELPPARLSTPKEPLVVLAVDIDGDGDQDLVSANRNDNTLTLFFGGR
jgi:hypothetical protein